jgi:hypothetical protein
MIMVNTITIKWNNYVSRMAFDRIVSVARENCPKAKIILEDSTKGGNIHTLEKTGP